MTSGSIQAITISSESPDKRPIFLAALRECLTSAHISLAEYHRGLIDTIQLLLLGGFPRLRPFSNQIVQVGAVAVWVRLGLVNEFGEASRGK
ncbi:MAG: hypothetical protein CMM45_03850 [Rhodospirillaceae bacterium]|nr:hypothetical protein [Rhodospirillaceae bacterium]|tara:strand:- start:250 stop:525 length:276 start_codon:yes stop_codon:yes gene_type:complete